MQQEEDSDSESYTERWEQAAPGETQDSSWIGLVIQGLLWAYIEYLFSRSSQGSDWA